MTRSRSTATPWLDTQPMTHARPMSKRRTRVQRRTVLTLACLAAGVGGTALELMPSPVKPARAAQTAAAAGPAPAAPVPVVVAAAGPAAVPVVVAEAQQQQQAEQAQQQERPVQAPAREAFRSDELRSQLRWVTMQVGQRQVVTLDADSRLLLARSAAQKAGLAEVGLDYRDVYGVIHAESSWVARTGMGKNGVESHGLAQFEPATARAVGLRNPNDPVEAVQAAAMHLKEAAQWSARRLQRLNLGATDLATKLREGVSVYYNLSTRGRNAWHGLNSDQMPVETRLHIRNVRAGALKADGLLTAALDGGSRIEAAAPAVVAATVAAPVLRAVAAVRAQPVRVAGGGIAPAGRTRVSFAAPRGDDVRTWVRSKDAITLPEGSIKWTARETSATGG